MFKWIKKKWNKKDCFYKVVKAFVYTFVLTFLTGIVVVLTGMMELSWKIISTAILLPALSAGITAAVNKLRGRDCVKFEENESENDKNE